MVYISLFESIKWKYICGGVLVMLSLLFGFE